MKAIAENPIKISTHEKDGRDLAAVITSSSLERQAIQ